MRCLVFGDVHGNLAALDAVLAAGQARGGEAVLCTGDLVGCGPDTLGCIERVAELWSIGSFAWVAGPHDRFVRGELELKSCSEEESRTLKWTRRLLAEDPVALEFLRTGEPTMQVNEWIFLAHDSLADPGNSQCPGDLLHAKAELACMRYRQGRVGLHGHTPTIRAELARESGEVVLPLVESHAGLGSDPHPLRLGPNEIGRVGTGSVGFPGNEKRWPEFLILDDQTWLIEKYAVEYDREAARARAREVLGPACGETVAERIARRL